MSGKNFSFGLLIGAALGAAVAVLSDRDKRDSLKSNLSNTVDRASDSLVDAYNEAKSKYMQYREKLTDATEELIDEVKEEVEAEWAE